MPTTAQKLRNAEEKIAKAQTALDKAQSGLHAAEEVAVATQKASRHPVLMAIGFVLVVGVIWMIFRSGDES